MVLTGTVIALAASQANATTPPNGPLAVQTQTSRLYPGEVGGTVLFLSDLQEHPIQGSTGESVNLTIQNRANSKYPVLVGRSGGGEHVELQPNSSVTFQDVDVGKVFVLVEGLDKVGSTPRCMAAGPYAAASPSADAYGYYAYLDYNTSGRPFVSKSMGPG